MAPSASNSAADARPSTLQPQQQWSTPVERLVGRARQSALAPPGLLRCLAFSWSRRRARVLRTAAGAQGWDAIAAADAAEFLRSACQLKVPLTVVDLPQANTHLSATFRAAAERVQAWGQSLVVVSVAEANVADELWARQLGAWSYLPEVTGQEGWELVFCDARQAVARQAITQLGST